MSHDIEVRSKDIILVQANSLQVNPNNRNHHTAKQIKRLKKLIKYQGFRSPIVVSNQSNFVVAGHGRLEAAKELGMDLVPVSFQDFTDPSQEYAHGIADNAIDKWSSLDLEGINFDMADLGPDFDIDNLGLQSFSLDVADKEEPKEKKPLECPECGALVTKGKQ